MSDAARFGLERLTVLGLAPEGFAALLVDAVLLLVVTGWLVRRWTADSAGTARRFVVAGLVFFTLVVGSATLLGAADRLSARAFVISHAVLALAVLTAGRRPGESIPVAFRELVGTPVAAAMRPFVLLWREESWRPGRRADSTLLAAIVFVLGLYLCLALFTLPLNFDANTYRLSRIALWLQHGDIYHFTTYDPRFNYAGQNADLAMLWLISFFSSGYPLVALVQFSGGVLACSAAWELAAQCGLGRRWRLGAVAMLLGIPTAATQFFTAQTDLFAAGCLAAGAACLLPALRGRRSSDWVLLGLGGGLALGTKATVIYWAPGLALLAAGWAWIEGSRIPSLLRGGLLAALVALPLSGFNFLLNQWDYETPVAPSHEVSRSLRPSSTAPDRWIASNVAILAGQILDPASNPLLPAAWLDGWSSSAIERAIEIRGGSKWFGIDLLRRASWLKAGLSEDYASFGVLAMVTAALGLTVALCRVATREHRRTAVHVSALALAVFSWFVVAVVWQPLWTLHQFRYFCLVAPALAVLGAYGLGALRSRPGTAVAALLVAAHLATAAYAGVASRHHGLRALVNPGSAPHYTLFERARAAAVALGKAPQRVVVALARDSSESWVAPFLRSGVAHQVSLASLAEVTTSRCVSSLLAVHGADLLLISPRLLRELRIADGAVEAVPSASNDWVVVRPSGASTPRPQRSATASGVFADGWTAPAAEFELSGCAPGTWTLDAVNPSPLERRVELTGARGTIQRRLAPLAHLRLELPVLASERVHLRVAPPFVPARHASTPDRRELGLLLDRPSLAPEAGVDGDGWLHSDAWILVRRWIGTSLSLTFRNPTPLGRVLTVHGAGGHVRLELNPWGTVKMEIPVRFDDRVSLSVRPAFVPSRELPGSADERSLGLLLSDEDRKRLGLPGEAGSAPARPAAPSLAKP